MVPDVSEAAPGEPSDMAAELAAVELPVDRVAERVAVELLVDMAAERAVSAVTESDTAVEQLFAQPVERQPAGN